MTAYTDYWIVEITARNLSTGADDTLYFSTFGYRSRPEDTPANQPYKGRMLAGVSIKRSLSTGKRIGGASETGYGSIRLSNMDRALDAWRSTYSFSGRPVTVMMLDNPTDALSTATTRFVGRISGEPKVGYDEAVLQVKDIKDLLDIEVQAPIFGGGENGLLFDSTTSGKALIATAVEMDLTGDMAVMARLKASALGNITLVGYAGGSDYPWRLVVRSDGSLRMRYTVSSTVYDADSTSTSMYAVDTWYAIGFRVIDDELYFFSRNLENKTDGIIWDGPHALQASTRDAQSGTTGFGIGPQGLYDGYVEEVRVWDGSGGTDYRRWLEMRVWPSEINANDTLKASYGSLVGYWRCNEGTGTTLTDLTSSGNDLALTGSVSWDRKRLGGNTDVAGRSMPIALGEVRRCEGVLVDSQKVVWQLSARSIEEVVGCTQNGGTITADTAQVGWGGSEDAPNFNSFMSATVASGGYITYLAQGLARTNSPEGAVLWDFKGDNVGGYVSDIDEMIERLAVDFGPLTSSDVDMTANSFDTSVHGKTAGIFIPAGSTRKIREWIDDMLVPRGFWYPARGTGKLSCGLIYQADGTGTVHTITARHLDGDRERPIEVQAMAGPTRGHRIGYERTQKTLQYESIADTVADDEKDLYTEEYRYITVEEDSIADDYLGAQDVQEYGTVYLEREDAYDEAIEMQAFKGVGTLRPYTLHLVQEPNVMEVGEEMHVTLDDLGFSDGKYLLIVGFDEQAMTARGWG